MNPSDAAHKKWADKTHLAQQWTPLYEALYDAFIAGWYAQYKAEHDLDLIEADEEEDNDG